MASCFFAFMFRIYYNSNRNKKVDFAVANGVGIIKVGGAVGHSRSDKK